jgi:hypothetical protein
VTLRLLLLVILPLAVSAADAPAKSLLERIEAGKLDPTPLEVSYDDLHPLHGGLVLTIQGTGKGSRGPCGKLRAGPDWCHGKTC